MVLSKCQSYVPLFLSPAAIPYVLVLVFGRFVGVEGVVCGGAVGEMGVGGKGCTQWHGTLTTWAEGGGAAAGDIEGQEVLN